MASTHVLGAKQPSSTICVRDRISLTEADMPNTAKAEGLPQWLGREPADEAFPYPAISGGNVVSAGYAIAELGIGGGGTVLPAVDLVNLADEPLRDRDGVSRWYRTSFGPACPPAARRFIELRGGHVGSPLPLDLDQYGGHRDYGWRGAVAQDDLRRGRAAPASAVTADLVLQTGIDVDQSGLDCGSNQGINALHYSRLIGETGRVLAFDPFPMNIEIAKFNAYLNGIANIDFIQAGLSDASANLTVAVADQSVGVVNDNAEDSVVIDLVPLDIFSSIRPDYIKIDVEGAEVNVLQGAATILSRIPAIYIEVHPQFLPRFGKTPMDIFKYIDLSKYRCYIDHPGRPFLAEYFAEYEIIEGCALYLVPRSRERVVRHSAG